MEGYRVPVAVGDRIKTGLALQLVAASTGVTVEEMTIRRRLGVKACKARRLAMYLAHVAFGWPLERVSHAFGLNRAAAATGCRWAENERDQPELDAMLERLEACVREVLSAGPCELVA